MWTKGSAFTVRLVALTPMLPQVKNSTMEFVQNGGCVALKTEKEIKQNAGACYSLALPLAEYF